MGLFGGGNSKSTSNTSIDNSVNDNSKNTNNAGASIGNTDNSYHEDNSVVNITDGGAFEVVSKAIEAGAQINKNSLDFGQSALDTASESIRQSNELTAASVDRSLAVAENRSATQSENVMSGVVKIGISVAVVAGLGFVAMGLKKK